MPSPGLTLPAETRYGVAVDVNACSRPLAQGWTLREISAELGIHSNTIGEQLQRAGIIRRSGGPRPIPPPLSRSGSCASKAPPGMRWPNRST